MSHDVGNGLGIRLLQQSINLLEIHAFVASAGEREVIEPTWAS